MQSKFPELRQVQTIACLMLADLGDVLVVTPTLHAIREKFPDARITLIVRSNVVPLIRHNPNYDELLIYKNQQRVGKALFLIRLLFRNRFDLWIDLHTPTFNTFCDNSEIFKRNALLIKISRPKYRLGFAVPQLAPVLTHPVPVPSHENLATENIVDTTLRVVFENGNHLHRKLYSLDVESQNWAKKTAETIGLKNPIIGFFFGAKQPAEIWRADLAQKFVRLLLEKYPNINLVLFGGELERQAANEISTSLPRTLRLRVHDLIGKTSLLRTGALMEHCSAIVSTNSGPMHMADGLSIPMVILFSSKNYLPIWLPTNSRFILINHSVPCSPCFKIACPINDPCIDLISPDEVLNALERLADLSTV